MMMKLITIWVLGIFLRVFQFALCIVGFSSAATGDYGLIPVCLLGLGALLLIEWLERDRWDAWSFIWRSTWRARRRGAK